MLIIEVMKLLSVANLTRLTALGWWHSSGNTLAVARTRNIKWVVNFRSENYIRVERKKNDYERKDSHKKRMEKRKWSVKEVVYQESGLTTSATLHFAQDLESFGLKLKNLLMFMWLIDKYVNNLLDIVNHWIWPPE